LDVSMLGACFAAFGNDVAPVGVLLVAYVIGPAPLGLPALAVLRRRLRDEAHDIAACPPGQAVEVLGGAPEHGRLRRTGGRLARVPSG